MPKPTDETPVVHDISSLPTDESTAPVEKRPNVAVRAYRKIKQTPPKTALAVVAGVGLVTAGAMLGRKTAPLHLEIIDSDFEPDPILVTPESDEADDTVA